MDKVEHPVMFLGYLARQIGGPVSEFAYYNPHVIYSWFIVAVLIVLGRLATAKITMVPSGLQNFFELVIESIENLQDSIMGTAGRVFFPLMATLLIYVAFCNLIGLLPGAFAPTANLNTTAGFAIIIFLLTHYVGFYKNGLSYLKHFMGPMLILAPLMFIIEIISHLSRLISLSLRLFGNVMGEELVVIILFVLAGAYFAPLPILFLGLLMGSLQAFVITLLAMVYISEAIGESH